MECVVGATQQTAMGGKSLGRGAGACVSDRALRRTHLSPDRLQRQLLIPQPHASASVRTALNDVRFTILRSGWLDRNQDIPIAAAHPFLSVRRRYVAVVFHLLGYSTKY